MARTVSTRRRLYYAWLVFALLAATLQAQRFSFRHYGHENGLSNLSVLCLLQDRTGYIWAGTENGLFRYDGATFNRFSTAEGLPGVVVDSLRQSRDDTIWVTTSGGLAYLSGSHFVGFPLPDRAEVIGFSSLEADAARDVLYLSTTLGLARIVKSGGQWTYQPFGPPARERVWSVHLDGHGLLWYGCGMGICRKSAQNAEQAPIERFRGEHGVPPDMWEAITTDQQGNLWARSSRTLIVLPKGATKFQTKGPVAPSSEGVVLGVDRRGKVMVPTDEGLERWTLTGHDRISTRQGLLSNAIASFLEDREGNVWIGSYSTGLLRWQGFEEWSSYSSAEGLSNDAVWAIAKGSPADAPGPGHWPSGETLWVGTDYGLNRLRPGEPVRSWTERDGLAGNRVRSIAVDPNGFVWALSAPGGISRVDPRSGRIDPYTERDGLGSERLLSIVWDRTGGGLLVSSEAGIFRGNAAVARVRFEKINAELGVADDTTVWKLLVDRNGDVWAGSAAGLFHRTAAGWTRFTRQNGLIEDAVAFIAEPPGGGMLIGYRQALPLSRITLSGGKLTVVHFDRRGGEDADPLMFLGADARGWVWTGTDHGVDVLKNGKWSHYSQAEGLAWDDTNWDAFLAEATKPDDGGDIWIGTSRGLAHFRPSSYTNADVPPPVLITSIRSGERTLSTDHPGDVSFADRFMEFSFASLTFTNEHEVRFRYRIQGVDQDWVETSQRVVRYPSLPPGSFKFELLARNPQGRWSETPATFTFRIRPPWWETWWFYGLSALAIALGCAYAWRWRTRQLTVKTELLEHLVSQRTSELEAEKFRTEEASKAKSEFLANMSHEIRTPLNGVLGALHLMSDTRLAPDQREYLEISRSSAESLLALLTDILDLSKIESGRMEINEEQFALRPCLELIRSSCSAIAARKQIGLQTEVHPDVPDSLIGDDVRLRQILMNLVGNALKFTERGSVSVKVELLPYAGPKHRIKLLFTVRDTGIGVARDKHQSIFEAFRQADGSTNRRHGGTGLGLSICRKLVALMGGEIWLESTPGEGSVFHFTCLFRPGATVGESNVTTGEHVSPLPLLKILLAEDNPVNQRLASRILEKAGHDVTIAADGRSACDMFLDQEFDLVLMDVQMPVMDGLEATGEIRKLEGSGHRTPIIAMTANAMKGDREKCIDAGMDAYVSKPIQPSSLFKVIQDVLIREDC